MAYAAVGSAESAGTVVSVRGDVFFARMYWVNPPLM
jgi:hypothetical protein